MTTAGRSRKGQDAGCRCWVGAGWVLRAKNVKLWIEDS